MISGRKILVAGGSGLVGSNLTHRLLREKAAVLSSYATRPPIDFSEVYRQFDFTRFEDCLRATADIEIVFVCAAQIGGVKEMRERPTASILPNLQISAGLLEACARNRVKKVVLLSSSTVYQHSPKPLAESDLDLNLPPYDLYFGVGWLNRYIEKLTEFYRRSSSLSVEIVRPTSIYGPYDQFAEEKAHVIPALIKRALAKERPFVVWGDGSQIRNFLYVEDLVDDLIQIALTDCGGKPINIAADSNTTIRDAVKVVLDATDHRVEPEYDATKPTSAPSRVLNTALFHSLFGKKSRTGLVEGVAKTIEWYRTLLATEAAKCRA